MGLLLGAQRAVLAHPEVSDQRAIGRHQAWGGPSTVCRRVRRSPAVQDVGVLLDHRVAAGALLAG